GRRLARPPAQWPSLPIHRPALPPLAPFPLRPPEWSPGPSPSRPPAPRLPPSPQRLREGPRRARRYRQCHRPTSLTAGVAGRPTAIPFVYSLHLTPYPV